MILLELHGGLFDEEPTYLEAPAHDGWRLITQCDRDFARGAQVSDVVPHCSLLRDSWALKEPHFEDFRVLMRMVLRKAQQPLSWAQMMSRTQFHDVGTVSVHDSKGREHSVPVFQFARAKTLLRVHWLNLRGRRLMLVTRAFVTPHREATTRAERALSGSIMQDYWAAAERDQAQLISAQGGIDAYRRLV